MLTKSEGPRGLGCLVSTDRNGQPYSFQESSLATEEAIWVGSHTAVCPEFGNPNPGRGPRLCREGRCAFAELHVGEPGEGTIRVTARMHLTRDMAMDLGEKLVAWAKHGDSFWEAAVGGED